MGQNSREPRPFPWWIAPLVLLVLFAWATVDAIRHHATVAGVVLTFVTAMVVLLALEKRVR